MYWFCKVSKEPKDGTPSVRALNFEAGVRVVDVMDSEWLALS